MGLKMKVRCLLCYMLPDLGGTGTGGIWHADLPSFCMTFAQDDTPISLRGPLFHPCGLLNDDLTCWVIGLAIIQTCNNGL